jgi:hypothetical protein
MAVVEMREPAGGPGEVRWSELIDRLVDGVTGLAADRFQLAGREVLDGLSRILPAVGLGVAAPAIGLLGGLFLYLALYAVPAPPDRLGPAGAFFVVAVLLLAAAAAAAAAAVRLLRSGVSEVSRAVAEPGPPPNERGTHDDQGNVTIQPG